MKKHLSFLMLLILFISCREVDTNNTISCSKIQQIEEFPQEREMKEVGNLPIDISGCVDMFHVDSLLICMMDNSDCFWKVISLNSMKTLCNIVPKGHGKNEFARLPRREMAFSHHDSLYVSFYDQGRNTIVTCNLTESIKRNQTVVNTKKISVNDDIANIFEINDSTYYIIKNRLNRGFARYLLQKGNKIPVSPGNLNEVLADEELNILSAGREINPQKTIIVEAMLRLNQINMYSLNEDFSVTLMMEPELQSVSAIEKTMKPMRKKYFGPIYTAEEWFAVLHYNTTLKDFFERTNKCSDILFFDWKGNPLLKLKIPMQVTSFFVYNHSLYVLTDSGESEQIHKYAFPYLNC